MFCLLTLFFSDMSGTGLCSDHLFSLCLYKWASIQHKPFPFRGRGILNRDVQSFSLLGGILGLSASGQCKFLTQKSKSLHRTVAVHINHKKRLPHERNIFPQGGICKIPKTSDKFKIYFIRTNRWTVKIHSLITRISKTCNQILARFLCFCIIPIIIITLGDFLFWNIFPGILKQKTQVMYACPHWFWL